MPQIKDKTTGRFSPMVLDENMLRQKHLVERKSSREIAKELGGDISYMTVHRALKEFGIFRRLRGEPFIDNERATIRRLYVEEQKSTPKVASELGIPLSRVDMVVKQFGARRTHQESSNIRWKKHYDEIDEPLIRKYVKEGKSTKVISKEMGVDAGSRLRELGVTRSITDANFMRYQGRIVEINDDEIRKMYIDQKLSLKGVARALGVSDWVILERLKGMGIDRRDFVEAGLLSWQRPDYIEKIVKGCNVKPNKRERHIDAIIQRVCPNEFAYNGGFERAFHIEGKRPDWVHMNGSKKLIENFGCFFHACQECGYNGMMFGRRTAEQVREADIKRLAIFTRNGFETLVIWGHDIDEEVIDKVRAFVFNGENANKEHITNEC